MSSWAKPGVKCVCIDNEHSPGQPPILVVGAVYEISRIVHAEGYVTGPYRNERVGVVLTGVSNPYDWFDGAFALARFRPLVTKTQEQEVAMFRHLLNSTPAGVDA